MKKLICPICQNKEIINYGAVFNADGRVVQTQQCTQCKYIGITEDFLTKKGSKRTKK
jgi:hypothetical protein